jgi:hypothetical protein
LREIAKADTHETASESHVQRHFCLDGGYDGLCQSAQAAVAGGIGIQLGQQSLGGGYDLRRLFWLPDILCLGLFQGTELVAKAVWFVLIMGLGNIAMSGYVLIQLFPAEIGRAAFPDVA